MKHFIWHILKFSFLLLISLELFFRVFPTTNYPLYSYDETYGIMNMDTNYNRSGLYTYGRLAQIKGKWNINNAGWNSAKVYRSKEKRKKPLIAIIGDSYIENLYGDVGAHFGDFLESNLDHQYTVYEFGLSGITLAQNILMAKYVKEEFSPDLAIFFVNHKDLKESIKSYGRDKRTLQLALVKDSIQEILPEPYQPSKVRRQFIKSALIRYLHANFDLKINPPNLIGLSEKKETKPKKEKENYEQKNKQYAVHLIKRIVDTARPGNVLFVLHPDREQIYANDTEKVQHKKDLKIIKEVLDDYSLDYLDLNISFQNDYLKNKRKFEFENNHHWNEYGNKVAAKAVANKVLILDLQKN